MRRLILGGPIIIEPRSRGGTETEAGRNGASLNGYQDSNEHPNGTLPLPSSRAHANASNAANATGANEHHQHHERHLLDLPEIIPDIDVDTGELSIPPEERALIEAEAPSIAESVEDIAEDRSWLSHKLLNIRTLLSFALAIGIIVFIFTRLDIDPVATWRTMLSADPLYLVAAFTIYYSAFWVRAIRWRMLLYNVGMPAENAARVPSTNGLVEIIYLSWFVNCIVPAKLGDAYRSYLLKRNSGLSFSTTIGTILAERVIDLLVLFGLLVASFSILGRRFAQNRGLDLDLVMLFGAGMVALLIVGLVGLRFYGHLIQLLVPHRFKEKFTSFRQGILRSFKRSSLVALLGLSVVIWLIEAGRLFFVTRSLDATDVTLTAVIFIALLSSLLTTLPLTPGGAGLVEGAVTLALGLFLQDHTLAVSIALLDRLINYWSLVVGGLTLYVVSKRR